MIFSLNSIKTTLSYGGSFQRQVWTDFQKICFYWAWSKIISVTKIFLFPTPPLINFKNSDILTQFIKNDPIRHLWWLFSETRMHRLPENMFLVIPGQDHFSNQNIFRSCCPIYRLWKMWYFHSLQEKWPYQTLVVVLFRGTYALTSRKYVFTDPKARLFQSQKIFSSNSPIYRF